MRLETKPKSIPISFSFISGSREKEESEQLIESKNSTRSNHLMNVRVRPLLGQHNLLWKRFQGPFIDEDLVAQLVRDSLFELYLSDDYNDVNVERVVKETLCANGLELIDIKFEGNIA